MPKLWEKERESQETARVYSISSGWHQVKVHIQRALIFVLLSRETDSGLHLNLRATTLLLASAQNDVTCLLCWLLSSTGCWGRKPTSLYIFLAPTHLSDAPPTQFTWHFRASLFTLRHILFFEIPTTQPVKGLYVKQSFNVIGFGDK